MSYWNPFAMRRVSLKKILVVWAPEQNNVVERRNQTLIEAGHTMIVETGISMQF